MSADLQGRALWDYYRWGNNSLFMHTSYAPRHLMPLEAFFKNPEEVRLERAALENCQGAVIDLGAGAGRFSLALQNRNRPVTALEISPRCCQLMRQRGVRQVVQQCFWEHSGQYDTVLLMMNGIGMAGQLHRVPGFFNKLKELMAPGGQIILDSSDLAYLYDNDNPPPAGVYYGEVSYAYEYKGHRGAAFSWLFLDWARLQQEAKKAGLAANLLYGPDDHQFLVKLQLN